MSIDIANSTITDSLFIGNKLDYSLGSARIHPLSLLFVRSVVDIENFATTKRVAVSMSECGAGKIPDPPQLDLARDAIRNRGTAADGSPPEAVEEVESEERVQID
jgi:hypothetical protein